MNQNDFEIKRKLLHVSVSYITYISYLFEIRNSTFKFRTNTIRAIHLRYYSVNHPIICSPPLLCWDACLNAIACWSRPSGDFYRHNFYLFLTWPFLARRRFFSNPKSTSCILLVLTWRRLFPSKCLVLLAQRLLSPSRRRLFWFCGDYILNPKSTFSDLAAAFMDLSGYFFRHGATQSRVLLSQRLSYFFQAHTHFFWIGDDKAYFSGAVVWFFSMPIGYLSTPISDCYGLSADHSHYNILNLPLEKNVNNIL